MGRQVFAALTLKQEWNAVKGSDTHRKGNKLGHPQFGEATPPELAS